MRSIADITPEWVSSRIFNNPWSIHGTASQPIYIYMDTEHFEHFTYRTREGE